MPTLEEIEKLIEVAKDSRKNAFAFISRRPKGAAVLTKDGQYFGGCNTENAISGLGTCAERSAVDHAVVHGCYEFKALALVYPKIIFPCGACLQYLTQFSQINSKDIDIILSDLKGNYKTYLLSVLLPHGFRTTKNIAKLKSYSHKS
jgi:cytidine deaminase